MDTEANATGNTRYVARRVKIFSRPRLTDFTFSSRLWTECKDTWFGVHLSLSGGPTHWRNNPNFRAPLVLAIGVAPREQPWEVQIFTCGNNVGCYQKDTITNVNGKVGPEAFEISNDGKVLAFGKANPGLVEVYEMTGYYYEGDRVRRETLFPSEANIAGSEVLAVRLSEDGNVLAVFESLPLPAMNVLRVYDWDGQSYQPRGKALLETSALILQRQLALSDDGTTVVVGLSECPNLDIMVFQWKHATSTWISLGSPPMREELCEGTHLAWSVATDRHGWTLVAGAYPNSDWVTAYEWVDGEWAILGDPIDGHYPGSETSVALSADGAHLVVGLPYAGKNENGLASTYSLAYSHCPAGIGHHFRLSLTTDYEPEHTLWSFEDVESGEVVLSGGSYQFPVGTLVEEECISTKVCHAFSIYNLEGPNGLGRPGRFDLFIDGVAVNHTGFSGRAKRISIGSECLTCPEGERLLRMLVHTCSDAEWTLEDSMGTVVVNGSTPFDKTCDDPNALSSFYWEEACVTEAECYSFTVTNQSPASSTNALSNVSVALDEYSAVGVEYLLLYDDDDVPVASETGILTSSNGSVGSC